MKRIALVGMPNTGKSTFFNRVTGASARVGNWPGITVELLAAACCSAADMVEIVDLPGIYDLHGFSDDERRRPAVPRAAARRPRRRSSLNASQIDRQLRARAAARRALGMPVVLLLNMADEAQQLGIRIDTAALGATIGMPVVLMSAKYGQGQRGGAGRAGARRWPARRGPTRRPCASGSPTTTAWRPRPPRRSPPRSTSRTRLPEHLTDRIDRAAAAPAGSGCRCSSR